MLATIGPTRRNGPGVAWGLLIHRRAAKLELIKGSAS